MNKTKSSTNLLLNPLKLKTLNYLNDNQLKNHKKISLIASTVFFTANITIFSSLTILSPILISKIVPLNIFLLRSHFSSIFQISLISTLSLSFSLPILYSSDKILYKTISGQILDPFLTLIFFEYGAENSLIKSLFFKFNKKRFEEGIKFLKILGGNTETIKNEKTGSEIESFLLKAKDFEDKIKEMGGSFVTENNNRYILFPEKPSEEWKDFEKNIFSKNHFWSKLKYKEKDAILISDCYKKTEKTQCAHIISMKRPASFNRSKILFFLGNGFDIYWADPGNLGHSKNKKTVSEGLLYSDSEYSFDHLIKNHNYDPKKVWIIGECGNTAVAFHLFTKKRDLGVNAYLFQLLPNPAYFIEKLSNRYKILKPIKKLLIRRMEEIVQSKEKIHEISEDGFNAINKLTNLFQNDNPKGKILIPTIKGDDLAPAEGLKNIQGQLKGLGHQTFIFSAQVEYFKGLNTATTDTATKKRLFSFYNSQDPHEYPDIFSKTFRKEISAYLFN